MKEAILSMLKRPPRPEAIGSYQKTVEFKKMHAEASKQITKKLTDTQLQSLYSMVSRWYL